MINFFFAIPAFFTIDRFGRRNLLLVTFPFLALFQLFSAIAFEVRNTGLVIAGLYLFALAYSPGEGPVPFVRVLHVCNWYHKCNILTCDRSTLQRACLCTYAILVRFPLICLAFLTEALTIPRHGSSHLSLVALLLHHRHHMAQLRKGFHLIRSFHVVLRLVHHRPGPNLLVRSLALVAGNLLKLISLHSFVPETKGVELEDLDKTFNISTRDFAREQKDWALYFVKRYILRRRKVTTPSAPKPIPTELANYPHQRHP